MSDQLKLAPPISVEDIMTTNVHAIHLTMTVREAIKVLVTNKISGAPIIDTSERAVSVLSEGDLLKLAATVGLDKQISGCLEKLVSSEKLITAKRSDPFVNVYRLFLLHPVHRIIIVDGNGRLQGIVSRSNILKTFVESDPKP